MANSPVKNSEGVVGVSVYVDNQVTPSKFGLESVLIRKEINRIGYAEIAFEAGNVADQTIAESEDATFEPGQQIRIEAGYEGDESILFQGIIVTHEVTIPPGESARLVIGCRDGAFPSTLVRQNRLFTGKKDSEALTEIWGNYSLSATIDSSTVKYPELIQYYCSDWDFTLSRADVNGWVVITEQNKISIQEPEVSVTSVVKLTYGVDIIEFNGTLQADAQLNDVSAWGWDSTQQKLVEVSAAKPTVNDQGECDPAAWVTKTGIADYTLQTGCVVEESALKSWAGAKRLKSALARITGSIRFQGNAKVNPGTIIELDGVGKRFNGEVYVGFVEHEIKNGNWYTTAGMGISSHDITAQADVIAPAASGLFPGIQGLHTGIVTKLEEDPLAEHRIEVEFPLLNGEKNKIWARMAHGWGSKNSGFFFLPDKGDEVVLGFLTMILVMR
ncbi:MAG: type VI secretion system tip protein VgrG [Tannerellaceae bacterium]|nr:type VI secretion system tip protein VgrG [Tannerellaceae bacterium]